jgi:ribose-phosphate pyrophosphokinase
MIHINGFALNVTRFPDKTSQVWRIQDGVLNAFKDDVLRIHWEFEDEYELLHIFQLLYFVEKMKIKEPANQRVIWDVPYLPYARQDKDIVNTSCWALHFFAEMMGKCELHTFDVHNPAFFDQYPNIKLVNTLPAQNIEDIVEREGIDLILFPDKGAGARYSQLSAKESIVADKTREESTGKITGIDVPDICPGKNILVCDDLCDGGRTFIEVAKAAERYSPHKMILYVSHGIFSQGLEALGSYYGQIYTRRGPVLCR